MIVQWYGQQPGASFRPLTGNHLVNDINEQLINLYRQLSFRPLTGNHLVNRKIIMTIIMNYVECFRPLTGNHLVNRNERTERLARHAGVSVPLRGII